MLDRRLEEPRLLALERLELGVQGVAVGAAFLAACADSHSPGIAESREDELAAMPG